MPHVQGGKSPAIEQQDCQLALAAVKKLVQLNPPDLICQHLFFPCFFQQLANPVQIWPELFHSYTCIDITDFKGLKLS